MKKTPLPVLITLLFFLFVSTPAAALEIGATPPDFELKNLQGEKARLSDFRGQIILLKLATTWCPTCKQQSAEIREAGKKLPKKNVVVVEVFLQDSEAMVRQYLQKGKYDMTHVALIDDGQAKKAYSVYLVPRVLLIDRDFKVRFDGSLIPAGELILQVEKINGK
jgi:peroxiredoxin